MLWCECCDAAAVRCGVWRDTRGRDRTFKPLQSKCSALPIELRGNKCGALVLTSFMPAERIEPPACAARVRRSNQLSYTGTVGRA